MEIVGDRGGCSNSECSYYWATKKWHMVPAMIRLRFMRYDPRQYGNCIHCGRRQEICGPTYTRLKSFVVFENLNGIKNRSHRSTS